MTRPLPLSKTSWRNGQKVTRSNGLHIEETGGRLARCVPFDNPTWSGRLEPWPVRIRDDVSQYRLDRSRGLPAPRFMSGWLYPTGSISLIPPRTTTVTDMAYVVRSYDQVILVAIPLNGRVVWVNPARYSMTTGGHQSAACRWTGHDLRHPDCADDWPHAHDDTPTSPSGALGGGQPSLADRQR